MTFSNEVEEQFDVFAEKFLVITKKRTTSGNFQDFLRFERLEHQNSTSNELAIQLAFTKGNWLTKVPQISTTNEFHIQYVFTVV